MLIELLAVSAIQATDVTPDPSQCPTVARLDLVRLGVRPPPGDAPATPAPPISEDSRREAASLDQEFAAIAVPPGDWRAPPDHPEILLRGFIYPRGTFRPGVRSVVWREADGQWWFWRQTHWADGPAAPPTHGRLLPLQVERVEAALADPCRALEPDMWPDVVPYVLPPPTPGVIPVPPPVWTPPPDFAPVYVELTEPGREPRMIRGSETHRTIQAAIVGVAIGPVAQ